MARLRSLSFLVWCWFQFQLSLQQQQQVAAQTTPELSCAAAEVYAVDAFSALTSSAWDECRSGCSGSTVCDDCVISDGRSAYSICNDGCEYTYGGLTVSRYVSAHNSVGLNNFNNYDAYEIWYLKLAFTKGAYGKIKFTLGGVLSTCAFEFNDFGCSCSEIYCDEAQQTTNYYIDCSLIEGGTILNFCDPPPTVLTPQSTDLEFLMYLPDLTCGLVGFEDPNSVTTEAAVAPISSTPSVPVDGIGSGAGAGQATAGGAGAGQATAGGAGQGAGGQASTSTSNIAATPSSGDSRRWSLCVAIEAAATSAIMLLLV